eukprot:TRINITY_DN11718_c0_g1_i1.p1 TRINITY_DN11718_c0_g1~~TRINITY_DN11718_c0_g1_i1.p1  ORF type:complete len:176 (-),score=34.33 TRINITY_DN11718_c0_g1_i1:49-576(-)
MAAKLFLFALLALSCVLSVVALNVYTDAESAGEEFYKRCIKAKAQKISCARIRESIEDCYENYGVNYASALNKTEDEILANMKDPAFVGKWNQIINDLVNWAVRAKPTIHSDIKIQVDREFSGYFLKVVVGDKSSMGGQTSVDPELLAKIQNGQFNSAPQEVEADDDEDYDKDEL